MVTLVIISLAGIALVRSVDTGVLVAGNVAFKEATHSVTSVGIEEATRYLSSTVSTANPSNSNLPNACANAGGTATAPTGTCRYFARTQLADSDGVPLIDWTSTNIPALYLDGSYAVVGTAAASTYEVKYVIERLCTADTNVSVALITYPAQLGPTADRCFTDTVDPQGSQKGGVSIGGSSSDDFVLVAVKYRVTVRATGPRNSVSIAQGIISF